MAPRRSPHTYLLVLREPAGGDEVRAGRVRNHGLRPLKLVRVTALPLTAAHDDAFGLDGWGDDLADNCCYTLEMTDLAGDGWDGAFIQLWTTCGNDHTSL